MDIAMLVYDELAGLDSIGPYEVLRNVPGWEPRFVAKEKGLVRDEKGALGISADFALAEVTQPDMVLVPGGRGSRALMNDEEVLDWLRQVDRGTKWTTSVCTGSLLLGAAGLLDGRRATTHWLEMETLAGFGAEPTAERVVPQGRIVTSAGVSSGIDMALWLAGRIAGDDVARAIQLVLEYDPQPPYDCGSVAKAPPEVTALVRAAVAARAA